MMKWTVRLSLVGALAAACLAIVAPASAQSRKVRVINETKLTIQKFYASNVNEDDWEEDILGDDVLKSGQAVNINIDDGTGACVFDFKVVFDDSSTKITNRIDVCEVSFYRYSDKYTGAVSLSDNRKVKVINETNSTMQRFYASSVNQDDWEEDILGDDVLKPGQSVSINIDDGTGRCMFDFKAVFSDGDELIRKWIDVCSIETYRYHNN